MPADITGDFTAAGGVAHVNRVLQVELFRELRQIVGVGVHVIAVPGLGGAAMTTAVVGDDSISLLTEKQHLSIPVVGGERPAVAEHDGLACTPVLVENLSSVFGGDDRHGICSP